MAIFSYLFNVISHHDRSLLPLVRTTFSGRDALKVPIMPIFAISNGTFVRWFPPNYELKIKVSFLKPNSNSQRTCVFSCERATEMTHRKQHRFTTEAQRDDAWHFLSCFLAISTYIHGNGRAPTEKHEIFAIRFNQLTIDSSFQTWFSSRFYSSFEAVALF